MRSIIVFITLYLLSGCASTDKELSEILSSVPEKSTIKEVQVILGEPVKEYNHNNYTVLYYCKNSKWNELSIRHLWFSGEELVEDRQKTSRGVICDKGVAKPSFSGVEYNDYSLFIPTSNRYGQDGLKTCIQAMSSNRYNNVFFDFESPLLTFKTGVYNYTDRYIDEEEVKAYKSMLTLQNECKNIAPKRQSKYLTSRFGAIDKAIYEKVKFEITTLYTDRRLTSKKILSDLINKRIKLNEAYNQMLRVESATRQGESDLLSYIADFKQKIAIAKAGRDINKTTVRVYNDSGIIPRCRMAGKC